MVKRFMAGVDELTFLVSVIDVCGSWEHVVGLIHGRLTWSPCGNNWTDHTKGINWRFESLPILTKMYYKLIINNPALVHVFIH